MPLLKLKKVIEYCSYDVVFFIFICLIIFLLNLIPDYSRNYFESYIQGIIQILVLILLNGYGMVIARDRINHGYRLPKIIPGDVINLGVKSTFVYGIFVSLQTAILYLTAYAFDLPIFDLHHLLLNFNETIDMFFANSPEYMLMFIFVGGLVFYFTTFFAEISLARLADTKKFFAAFDFMAIWRSIKIFGFRKYVLDYTSLIVAIVVLTLLQSVNLLPDILLDNLWEMIFGFLIFATQYLGIGAVYCDIKDAEIKSRQFK